MYKDMKERLDLNSKENKDTGCIEWQRYLSNGYGKLMIGSRKDGTRKTTSAHRVSYVVHKGPIPDGLYVLHKCDNRKCINPDHLFLGTHQDNIDDREAKNRNNHTRKLSDEDVAYIHENKGTFKSKELAAKFGVSYHTIKDVWCGKIYPYLKPTPPQTDEEEA
jgi:hypothetical protein